MPKSKGPQDVVGPFRVRFPDASMRAFLVKHDLAGLLGVESNGIARQMLDQALSDVPKAIKDRIGVDHESDFVFVTGDGPEVIVEAVRILLSMAKKPGAAGVSQEDWDRFVRDCKEYKVPKARPWKINDVFAIPLKDNSHTFGIVLEISKMPLVGVFDHHQAELEVDWDRLKASTLICIQNTTPEQLDQGTWPIVGQMDPGVLRSLGRFLRKVISGGQIPSSVEGSGILDQLANAWHGFLPWNSMHEEDYFDKLLRFGVRRPKSAVILSPEDRKAFRDAQGWN